MKLSLAALALIGLILLAPSSIAAGRIARAEIKSASPIVTINAQAIAKLEHDDDLGNLLSLTPTNTGVVNFNKGPLVVRGLGQGSQNLGIDVQPGSSVYLHVLVGTGLDDFGIAVQNIEVLRGPQGTLFGSNQYLSERKQFDATAIIAGSPFQDLPSTIEGEVIISDEPILESELNDFVNTEGWFGSPLPMGVNFTTDGFISPPIGTTYTAGGITSSTYQNGHENHNWGSSEGFSGVVVDAFNGLANRNANLADQLSHVSFDAFFDYTEDPATPIDGLDRILSFNANNNILDRFGLRLSYWDRDFGDSDREFTGDFGTARAFGQGTSAGVEGWTEQLEQGNQCFFGVTSPGGFIYHHLVGTDWTLGSPSVLTAHDANRLSPWEGGYDSGLFRHDVSDTNGNGTLNLGNRDEAEIVSTICFSYDLNDYFQLKGTFLPEDDTEYRRDFQFTDISNVQDPSGKFASNPIPSFYDFTVGSGQIYLDNPGKDWTPVHATINPSDGTFLGMTTVSFSGETVSAEFTGNILDSGFYFNVNFSGFDDGATASFDGARVYSGTETHLWQKLVNPPQRTNAGWVVNGYHNDYIWRPGSDLSVGLFINDSQQLSNRLGGSDLDYTLSASTNVGNRDIFSYSLDTNHFTEPGYVPTYSGPPIDVGFADVEALPPYKNIGVNGTLKLTIDSAGGSSGGTPLFERNFRLNSEPNEFRFSFPFEF